jgi:hypothetical protein
MRPVSLVLLGAVLALGACDLGPSVGPPAEVAISSFPQSVEAGRTLTGISVTVTDRDGKPVPGAAVEWSPTRGSASPATGTTNAEGVARTDWTVGTTAGSQAMRARVGGLEAIRTVTVAPGPLATLTLAPATLSFQAVGDTASIALTGMDQYQNEITLTAVSWSSSANGVATVQNGVVVSRGVGSAQISAEAAGVGGQAAVTVTQIMTGVRISPTPLVLVPDETVRLEARAIDARGTPMDTTFSVSWASSNPQIASLDQSGNVTARAVGTTVVSASAGSYSDETTVDVRRGPRPVISAITPATLAPGDTAVIAGSGFSTTTSENQVTVGGIQLSIASATGSQIRAVMPPFGQFPCGPTATKDVAVTVAGLSASTRHPVAGAVQRALAVGESVALHGNQVACNELSNGGTYIVSVFNTTGSATARTAFRLRGTAAAPGLAPLSADAAHVHTSERIRAPVIQPDPEAEAHHWMLEQNNRTMRELAARTPRTPPLSAQQLQTAAIELGASRTFRIPDLDASGSLCNSFHVVTARAVYVGEKSVIWEDQAAPLAGQMNDRWRQTGAEYDAVMHPIILEYFGDPQGYDAWLENQGRVHMLFSKRVNDFTRGVNGFVFSGDFFPMSQCTQSNQAPIFYGRIPTEPGSGYTGYTADTWAWSMRATIIHEVKHIVSYATKLRLWREGVSSSPNYEVTWLEEATARLAEEFYARALSNYGQGDNVTYQQSIFCERRVGANWPQCDPIPNMIYKHFGAIYQYYKNVESLSPIGPAHSQDWTFYGSGWLLVRWAMDHSGQSEQAFSRALVNEPSVTGELNLSNRMGRGFNTMLADFTLAMMMDDHPQVSPTRAELRFPGWNTRDMMKGMHDDHQGTSLAATYDVPWPLSARDQAFGNFDRSVDGIQGGTATFFRLTGSAGQRQLLELLSSGGITAPAALGLAIVRVQ